MADDKYKINNDLLPVFNSLQGYFEEHSKDTLSDQDWHKLFDLLLKATIIKAYEFSLSIINLKGDNIYFMLPALRGICEEFIVEKFILEKFTDAKERNFIMSVWQQHGILRSSIAQWEYFKINKPTQVLYYEDSFPTKLKDMEGEIKKHFKRKFPNSNFKSPFPSVYYMAKETGLVELYNYLYHASSTFVHFNPQNLFRMSWGNCHNMKWSTNQFKHYYNDFIIYNSATLFCNLCEWQFKNGYLNGFDENKINEMKSILNSIGRHPEIVTFEEMNIGAFSRIMLYKSPEMVSNINKTDK